MRKSRDERTDRMKDAAERLHIIRHFLRKCHLPLEGKALKEGDLKCRRF